MINCNKCRFWQPLEVNEGMGICRRDPPGMSADLGVAAWPNTAAVAMCGMAMPVTDSHQQPEPWPRPPEGNPHAH